VFRKLCFGAAAVLSVGILAVGCGDDGDTIIIGGGTELNNSDALGGSSIASNNLADDGGGLSPNGTDVDGLRIVWCCDSASSDGNFSGNNDAMVFFTTNDGTDRRVFATNYNGSSFTPPVELKAEDRNEQVAVDLDAVVAVCLTTASYAGATGATNVATIRSNAGNWVIAMPGTTFFADPRLSAAENFSGGLVGPRQTIWSYVWLRAQRDVALTSSMLVGGVARDFRYGFQETGNEIVPTAFRAGGYTGGGAFYPNSTINVAPTASPANDVTSFGMITDAWQGQASFGGNRLPYNGTIAGPSAAATTYNDALYRGGEDMSILSIYYTQVANSMSGGGSVSDPNGNAFSGGAEIKHFQGSFNLETLAWETPAEIANEPAQRNAGTANNRAGTAPFCNFHVYNNILFYKYMDASLNTTSGTGFGGSNPLSMVGVNNAFGYDNTGGNEGAGINGSAVMAEEIIAKLVWQDDGDGTSSPVAASHQDLSFNNSAAGLHDLTNPSTNAGFGNITSVAPNREIQNFNLAAGDVNSGELGRGGRFIFGPDEGLVDIAVFYTSADNTRVTARGDNIDRFLACATLNPDGTFVTSTTNPSQVSAHEEDHQETYLAGQNATSSSRATAGGQHDLEDPLLGFGTRFNGQAGSGRNVGGQAAGSAWFFDACMSRTGEYINVLYIQDAGVSVFDTTGGFAQALHVVTYQTFRSGTGTTGGTAVQPNHDVRFAGPTRVSATSLGSDDISIRNTSPNPNLVGTNGGISGGNTGLYDHAETVTSWNTLPVNSATWQGKLGYRLGFQSNRNIMSVLYEQSDSTEDRLFASQITVTLGTTGTPTHAATTPLEFDATATVVGHDNFDATNTANANSFTTRDTFRFLDGDVNVFSSVMSCDLGADSAGAGGGILVVYHKVVDGTSSDNDHGDSNVIAVRVAPGQTAIGAGDRAIISRNLNENAAIPAAPAPMTNPIPQFTSSNSGTSSVAWDARVLKLVCVANNTDIVNNADYSGNGVYIYMTDSRSQNNNDPTGLFTRKHETDERRNAQTALGPNIGDRMVPLAAIAVSDPTYAEPARIDHLQSNNVTQLQCCQAGESVLLTFMQENHIWGQVTADGLTYLASGGAPNPALVDNDSSADIGTFNVLSCCEDSNGDSRDSLLGFSKDDVDQDERLRFTTGNRP
jgi:hypothetical protein